MTSSITPSIDEIGLADIATITRARDVGGVVRTWLAHDEVAWSRSAEPYVLAASRLVSGGEPLSGYDVVAEGLRHFPANVRLRQLQGLALGRSGAIDRAIHVLSTLADEPGQSPAELDETLGTLGGVHKLLAIRSGPDAARSEFVRARDRYLAAYQLSGHYYPGINAATTMLLSGEARRAAELAAEVERVAMLEYDRSAGNSGDSYWSAASVAEAALVQGHVARALDWYGKAWPIGRKRPADLATTRRNARLVAGALGLDVAAIEATLRVPSVATFLAPLGSEQAFAEGAVAAAIARLLEAHDVGFAYSPPAAGPEIVFLECARSRDACTRVLLPYDVDEFVADRVARIDASQWRPRFDDVLATAEEVIVATDRRFAGGSALHEYADRLLYGLARVQALELDTTIVPIVALDGSQSSDEVTQHLARLRSHGIEPEIVALTSMSGGPVVESSLTTQAPATGWGSGTRILGILFADVEHSSQLTDDQQPLLVEHFLGLIGRLARESPNRPSWKNTWGDGLYFVFDGIGDAARFALELRDAITSTDWGKLGLRPGLTMRIGLHGGPIFPYMDPITGYQNFTGRHTIRGARIEPVTLPGQVYASREFAALAAAEHLEGVMFTPVGRVTLAKNAAVTPLFVVDWSTPVPMAQRPVDSAPP
jgi:class 3 adenylate cyclase